MIISNLFSCQPHDGSADVDTEVKDHMGKVKHMDTSHPALEEETHKILLPAIEMVNDNSKKDLEDNVEKDAAFQEQKVSTAVVEYKPPACDLETHQPVTKEMFNQEVSIHDNTMEKITGDLSEDAAKEIAELLDTGNGEDVIEGKTTKDPICEETHLKLGQQPQDTPSTVGVEAICLKNNLKQNHDQGKALKKQKQQVISILQKKAAISNKQPSQKAQRKEEKRKRKATMDSPQHPSEGEQMVVSAVQEIWKMYALGQGPKDLIKLPDPCPPEPYLKDNGQHLSSIRTDYLKVSLLSL